MLVFVGGNSSVHGYDHNGCEMFWTAVGDVVTALILLDYNKDGLKEVPNHRARWFQFWFYVGTF